MKANPIWDGLSLNQRAGELLAELCARAAECRISCERVGGALLVDAGIDAPGGIEAGLRIAEICLGGLGRVSLVPGAQPGWPFSLSVHAADPALACLGSQYAGWRLSHGSGKEFFQALGSGPGRALALKEPLFEELGYRDEAEVCVLVMETDKRPPLELLRYIAETCGVALGNVSVALTPTNSLAGSVQVAARVLEVALHKAHELGFALAHIEDGVGAAPLAPPAPDFVTAMGRTNDAILFAGQAHLFVRGEEDDARSLCEQLPSCASRDYGRPFAEIFKRYDHDFFKIDPMLFSPALVSVTHLPSGRTFRAGRVNMELLERSFA